MFTARRLRDRRCWRIWTKILALGTLLLLVWSIFQLWPVWLVPGPKTTVITGPLRADGTVDYAAALNHECSEGVTPDNNAVVLLLQALGPAIVHESLRGAYVQQLGIDPPPLDGPYLQTLEQLIVNDVAAKQRVIDELDQALKVPWDETEFPEIAQWLAVNEQPLKLCSAACRRERYFEPLVLTSGESLAEVLHPLQQESRNVSRLLGVRATFQIRAGRIDEALADAESMHRMSSLVGQHPFILSQLVAYAHLAMACQVDGALVNSCMLSAEQARRQRKLLGSLPTVPAVTRCIDHSERYLALDIVQTSVWSQRWGWLLDGNSMLRQMNDTFDEFVVSIDQKDVPIQRLALENLEDRLGQRAKQKLTLTRILAGRRFAVSSQMADVFAALVAPAMKQAAISERRARLRRELILVGYALAEYRAVTGQFPESLKSLVPEFLEDVPPDPHSDQPVRYVVDAEQGTILLYSIGENGIDEHGRMDGPRKADDIAFGAVPDN